MHMWEQIAEKEVAKLLDAGTSLATKKRMAAFDRAAKNETGRGHFQQTKITVAEKATMEIPLAAAAGVRVVEITQNAGSSVKISYIQNVPATESGLLILRVHLAREAQLETLFGMFGGSSSGLIVETFLEGERSSVKEKTVYFGADEQVFDIFSNTTLVGRETTAEIESRGILTGRAQARFDGAITIKESAKKATARLNEHTLLLSADARMNAIPGLKIETNDVMATHAASMTRVDDEQLFYCKSRGIPESTAIRLIAKGFIKALYADTPHKAEIQKIMKEKIKFLT